MKTIPEEILVDILSRLPAKSIGRSCCVSKRWRHLLSELRVIKDHLNETKQFTDSNQSLILFADTSHALYTARISVSGQREVVMVKDEETVNEKLVMYDLDRAVFKDVVVEFRTAWIGRCLKDEFQGSFLETLVSPYYRVIG